MSDLVERLRNGLSMSMFASRADLHEAELELRQQAADEIERLRNAYNDLVMRVGKKHPGETRHETAARYIDAAEADVGGAAMQAKEGA